MESVADKQEAVAEDYSWRTLSTTNTATHYLNRVGRSQAVVAKSDGSVGIYYMDREAAGSLRYISIAPRAGAPTIDVPLGTTDAWSDAPGVAVRNDVAYVVYTRLDGSLGMGLHQNGKWTPWMNGILEANAQAALFSRPAVCFAPDMRYFWQDRSNRILGVRWVNGQKITEVIASNVSSSPTVSCGIGTAHVLWRDSNGLANRRRFDVTSWLPTENLGWHTDGPLSADKDGSGGYSVVWNDQGETLYRDWSAWAGWSLLARLPSRADSEPGYYSQPSSVWCRRSSIPA